MTANTPALAPGRRSYDSKSGGGLIWTAGFLTALALMLAHIGGSDGAVVSLDQAMGADITTERL